MDQKPTLAQLNGVRVDDSAASAPAETPHPELDGTPTQGKKPRKARISTGKAGKKIGIFEESEIQAVEKYKVDFCNLNGVEASTFDAIVQHSQREGEDFPCPTDICTKAEFWSAIYELMPNRDRRSVYRFLRRHFQDSDQKPHEWTAEQDEDLIMLRAKHGPKYAFIARILGRTSDDVTQRWKNRLEHRKTMQRGPWSEQELRDLLRYVLLVGESSQQLGMSSDVYEMDDKIFPWGKISDQMKNSRSRQQCADKWRKIRRDVLERRATSDPNAVFNPRESKSPGTQKSKVYVEEEDSEDEGNESAQTAKQTGATTVSAPEADPRSQSVSGDLSESPNQQLVEEEASLSEDDEDEHSSPATQRSEPASEKQEKKQKKAREINDLAEAEGLTLAEAKEQRKQEKTRRKSLKGKRTSAVIKADINEHTQYKQASPVQSQAGSDNDSNMSHLEDHSRIKQEV